jgi:hypothetical protein
MADKGEAVLASLSKRIINMEPDIIVSMDENEENTEEFVERMKNYNTKTKTKSDVSKFVEWLASITEHRNLVDIPPKELDNLLARFWLNVRKSDGTEYEPGSLSSFRQSIWRHLKEKQYSTNIMTDPAFQHSSAVLQAKRKDLKSQGKGNRPMKSEAFSPEDIDLFYSKHLLRTGLFINSITY